MTNASIAEANLCRALRAVFSRAPTGSDIQQFDEFSEILSGLEFFLTEVLCEIHPEWESEGLDGVLPYLARTTAEREAEIIGHCVLITDQTTTPFYLHIQISPGVDEVSWLALRMGENGPNGMARRPYENPPGLRQVAMLSNNIGAIDWTYKVEFGERR